MKRVSIITGFYNRGDKLERTLDSLRRQNFDDFEIVVFNDASTDDTGERLLTYSKTYPAAPLVIRSHTQNMGFVRGMIAAVNETKSDYIAVQGSGDVAHPERLREQAAVLDADPTVVAVGCWYHSVSESTGERQLRQPCADAVTFEELVAGRPPFTHGEVMFRRSAYEKAGGYRPAFTFSQDYDLWLRLIRLGHFRTVPTALYDRYTLGDGVSYDPRKRAMQLRYSILARQLATCVSEEEALALLVQLEAEGPEKMVPLTHPYIQKQLFKSAIASIAWSNPSAAMQIENAYLIGLSDKWTVRAVRALCDNVFGRSLLRHIGTKH